jgi:hypothetical protein
MINVGFVFLIVCDWQVNMNLPQYAALQMVCCHFGMQIIAWFFSAPVFIVYWNAEFEYVTFIVYVYMNPHLN